MIQSRVNSQTASPSIQTPGQTIPIDTTRSSRFIAFINKFTISGRLSSDKGRNADIQPRSWGFNVCRSIRSVGFLAIIQDGPSCGRGFHGKWSGSILAPRLSIFFIFSDTCDVFYSGTDSRAFLYPSQYRNNGNV